MPRLLFLCLAPLLLGLALLAEPGALGMGILGAWLVWRCRDRGEARFSLFCLAPIAPVPVVYLALRAQALGDPLVAYGFLELSVGDRVLAYGRNLVHDLALLLSPLRTHLLDVAGDAPAFAVALRALPCLMLLALPLAHAPARRFLAARPLPLLGLALFVPFQAGTGSFLEEQAEKLDISIKGEFGSLALSAKEPVRMGERCTVFIESDLVHHQQRGARKDDLIAGLSYSIVHNYLNRVVGDRRIGDRIFFQGGTAFNQGVVSAFENVLDKKITVPENHDVTGAIGVAILAMEERTWERSSFKGFDLSQRRYEQSSFECKGCPNLCLIRKVSVEGEKPLFYGSRCEKYDVIKRTNGSALPDLFGERERLLFAPCEGEETRAARTARSWSKGASARWLR